MCRSNRIAHVLYGNCTWTIHEKRWCWILEHCAFAESEHDAIDIFVFNWRYLSRPDLITLRVTTCACLTLFAVTSRSQGPSYIPLGRDCAIHLLLYYMQCENLPVYLFNVLLCYIKRVWAHLLLIGWFIECISPVSGCTVIHVLCKHPTAHINICFITAVSQFVYIDW